MAAKTSKPRLGRGLSSLMPSPVSVAPPKEAERTPAGGSAGPASDHADAPEAADGNPLQWVPVDRIEPNPYQPRRAFDQHTLEQLAASIRQDGMMQPVVLRPDGQGDRYQLVAGERRWRAADQAGLKQIPALVRELDERQLAEWAVIENLQREDLNPIERAEALGNLAERFELSHQQVAERIGLDRSTLTNLLRLLELEQDVQELVRLGKLSAGHGRTLRAIDDPEAQCALARKTIDAGWSVRRLEQEVRRGTRPADQQKGRKTPGAKSKHLTDLEAQIGRQLGTKVSIKPGKKKNTGTLSIDFYDLDQFDTLLEKLGVNVE